MLSNAASAIWPSLDCCASSSRSTCSFTHCIKIAARVRRNARTAARDRFMAGQVWRLVTYMFIPQVIYGPDRSNLSGCFYTSTSSGSSATGSNRRGAASGSMCTICSGCSVRRSRRLLHRNSGDVTGFYLNLSLFFAFATLFPDYPILLYVRPPGPGEMDRAGFAGLRASANACSARCAERVAIAVSLANYILFFGPSGYSTARAGPGRGAAAAVPDRPAAEDEETLHHCKVCGRNGSQRAGDGFPRRQRRRGILPPASAVARRARPGSAAAVAGRAGKRGQRQVRRMKRGAVSDRASAWPLPITPAARDRPLPAGRRASPVDDEARRRVEQHQFQPRAADFAAQDADQRTRVVVGRRRRAAPSTLGRGRSPASSGKTCSCKMAPAPLGVGLSSRSG